MLINVSSFQFQPISNFVPSKVSDKWVGPQKSIEMNAPFISLGLNNHGYTTAKASSPDDTVVDGKSEDGNPGDEQDPTRKEKRAKKRLDRQEKRMISAGPSAPTIR